MKVRLFLPLFVIFIADCFFIPVLFVGALAVFLIHALLLLFLRCTLESRWHRAAVGVLLAFQMWRYCDICDFSSGISCVAAAMVHLPVWFGYLVMRLTAKPVVIDRQL